MFDITLLKVKQMSVAQGTPWLSLIHSLNFSDFFRSLGNHSTEGNGLNTHDHCSHIACLCDLCLQLTWSEGYGKMPLLESCTTYWVMVILNKKLHRAGKWRACQVKSMSNEVMKDFCQNAEVPCASSGSCLHRTVANCFPYRRCS